MATKTFTVQHEGTHYPTDEQNKAALREALKAEGLKFSGDVEFFVVENTSGGPSKVRATYEPAEQKAKAADETKTVGISAPK